MDNWVMHLTSIKGAAEGLNAWGKQRGSGPRLLRPCLLRHLVLRGGGLFCVLLPGDVLC